MSQKAIELILMRQLASSLAMPIFLVDPSGNLLFYNEPAEQLLGSRYDETGEMSMKEWSTLFAPIGEDGSSVPGDDGGVPDLRRKPLARLFAGSRTRPGCVRISREAGVDVRIRPGRGCGRADP